MSIPPVISKYIDVLIKEFDIERSDLEAIYIKTKKTKRSKSTKVSEEPAVEEPVVEEPAVEEPVVEEPAVEEPAVEEPVVEEPVVEEPVVEDESVLMKYKRDALVKLCKEKGLKYGGTKTNLIDRLLGKSDSVSKKRPKSKKKKATILSNLERNKVHLHVVRNEFNNYEDKKTRFILDPATHFVVGKQSNNGDVLPLNEEDYLKCKELNLEYNIPIHVNDTEN